MSAWTSSLLSTLDELTAWSRPLDFDDMTTVVRLLGNALEVDVCSLYLVDHDQGELVLSATVGLRWQSVGEVRLRPEEGLTGLAAQKRRPVLVTDAPHHPRFKPCPEVGEEPYQTFFAVPLIAGRSVEGVLVVETLAARNFEAHERQLVLDAAQKLAPYVALDFEETIPDSLSDSGFQYPLVSNS